jgi:hypothetical protein
MKHRKLRIAWSAAWGIAAVLLLVLWPISYWYSLGACDHMNGPRLFCCWSDRGQIMIDYCFKLAPDPEHGWFTGVDKVNAKSQPLNRNGWTIEPGSWTFAFSHHLYLATATVLSLLPWVRWSKRFGLRIFLIVTIFVAVLISFIVRTCLDFEPY